MSTMLFDMVQIYQNIFFDLLSHGQVVGTTLKETTLSYLNI